MTRESKLFSTLIVIFIAMLISLPLKSQSIPTIYIDSKGVMRWNGTQKEASFFGVNYTMPFAYAYRAAGYLNIDRKTAIDEDVYHFARLGFNAFRIHIWDVEISGSDGELIENDHLNLLDYLISKLNERGIYTVITAQTSFGNGYPERNIITEGYSYKYDKCDIHRNQDAIRAQERYIYELVNHKNQYTGVSYKNDPYIIGFEINNEPCHAGSVAETKSYIARMVKALKQAGNKKPVFYNVSHNEEHREAYFSSDIQGTTYQWYPSGLVSGGERRENYLPNVDKYHIPFSNIKGFKNKAKLIYEFDPADIAGSYIYPATVRSFKTAGFQWITQFAYDPMSIAGTNSEYQTHYLNLAYTPGKAISMKIAAMASQLLPVYSDYGTYPDNAQFGDFRVSYEEDLSEFNDGECFFYSNNTSSKPKNAKSLKSIAGVGSSPVVNYSGTGAYFIDKLEDGVWRLEVMPDVVNVSDPFAKPTLEKEVRRVYHNHHNMKIMIDNLGDKFSISGINPGNNTETSTSNALISSIGTGVYILKSGSATPKQNWTGASKFGNIIVGEFASPASSEKNTIYHEPAKYAKSSEPLTINATVASNYKIDSVVVYTDRISFWNDHNPYYTMTKKDGNSYETAIPAEAINGNWLNYNIVMFANNASFTAPAMVNKTPLDWDYTQYDYYSTKIMNSSNIILLYSPNQNNGLFIHTMPDWKRVDTQILDGKPTEKSTFKLEARGGEEYVLIRKNIENEIKFISNDILKNEKLYLCIDLREVKGRLLAGFVTSSGVTYKKVLNEKDRGIVKIPLEELTQSPTWLLPQPYPAFSVGKYTAPSEIALQSGVIQSLEISISADNDTPPTIEFGDMWLERIQ